MLHTCKCVYNRSLEKTRDQVFINSFRKEFELSPTESQEALDLTQRGLFGEIHPVQGPTRFFFLSHPSIHEQACQSKMLLYLINSDCLDELQSDSPRLGFCPLICQTS